MPAHSNESFPKSKEDYLLLKSLGLDKAVMKFEIRYDSSINPFRATGVKLYFKNGKEILLRKIGNDSAGVIVFNSKSPASMKIDKGK